jgi:ATP-binding cassette subfamily A (ABC1) protein 3
MIGNPNVVFLDEPSSGMNCEARGFMWNVISRISAEKKLSSIILSTHLMEEAEVLATKMSIMVNDGLKCMGTTQHIKTKYSGGYEIEIKLHMPDKDLFKNIILVLSYEAEDLINTAQVNELMTKMNGLNLPNQLNENGSGSVIYAQIMEWLLVEKSGETVQVGFFFPFFSSCLNGS